MAVDGRELERGPTGIGRALRNLFEAADLVDAPLRFQVLTRSELSDLSELGQRGERVPLAHYATSQLEDWRSFARAERESYRRGAAWDVYLSLYYKLPRGITVPSVCFVHDLTPLEWGGALYRRYYDLRVADSVRRASCLVTGSEHVRTALSRRYRVAPEAIVVVPHGVSQRFSDATQPGEEGQRAGLGVPPKGYLLYVGNDLPHKNLRGLLAGYARLPVELRDRHSLVLTVRAAAIRRYAQELGLQKHLVPIGRVPEPALPALYRGAALFVFPSLSEGFGLPVLEAMACGVAVAVSDIASLREVAGEAGSYFDSGSAHSIAGTLVDTLADGARRARAVRAGLERARRYRLPGVLAPLLRLLASRAHASDDGDSIVPVGFVGHSFGREHSATSNW